jgi:hypothetical protein
LLWLHQGQAGVLKPMLLKDLPTTAAQQQQHQQQQQQQQLR